MIISQHRHIGLDQVSDFLSWAITSSAGRCADDYRLVVAKYIDRLKRPEERPLHRFGDHEPLVVAEDRAWTDDTTRPLIWF